MLLPLREFILIDSNDFQFILHPLVDLSHLWLRHHAWTTADAPEVKQHIFAIGKGFEQTMFLSLHIKEFGINSFITHLQESWRIDIVVNLCQLLLKSFRSPCDNCLFQLL